MVIRYSHSITGEGLMMSYKVVLSFFLFNVICIATVDYNTEFTTYGGIGISFIFWLNLDVSYTVYLPA